MTPAQEYVTLDLGEATALKCVGCSLIGLRKTAKRGQRSFAFVGEVERRAGTYRGEPITNLSDARSIAEEYWKPGSIALPARLYYQTYKELRHMVHEELDADASRE